MAGVIFGTDRSRPVNINSGSLIIVLGITNIVYIFDWWTPVTKICIYFLLLTLGIIVIVVTEKQRPLASVNAQIDAEIKNFWKQIVKKVLQK